MEHPVLSKTDYGAGQKKLSIYLVGFIICSILTLISFWIVMTNQHTKMVTFTIIYTSAVIQLFVQVICFLRLNTHTEQARINVMSLIFTFVILISIIIGSLWIMWNLNYFMMH